MFKFSTKSHYIIGQAETEDDRRVKLKYNFRASIAANRLLAAGNFALRNECPPEMECFRFLRITKNQQS
jgi:hypothetical protein